MLVDGPRSDTFFDQQELEQAVFKLYAELGEQEPGFLTDGLQLDADAHIQYLHRGFQLLPSGFVCLDASRPWICYWILHSLALLRAPLPPSVSSTAIYVSALAEVVKFLSACQHASGGFGGGPGQYPHLAPTYAAVASLVTLGGAAALGALDRAALKRFLERSCVPAELGGGFEVTQGGEVDVRGCYTALAAASMCGLDAVALAERACAADYVARCQTYEGGLGGEPGNEAHGGYTYCGLAALLLINRADVLNLPSLLHWAVHRQGALEGGFMGRTNKLVDGCYSFWQGGLFPLLQRLIPEILSQSGIPRNPTARPPPARQKRMVTNAVCDAISNTIGSLSGNLAVLGSPVKRKRQLRIPQLPPAKPLGPRSQASDAVRRLKVDADAAVRRVIEAEAACQGHEGVDTGDWPEMDQRKTAATVAVEAAREAREALEDALAYEDAVQVSAAVLCPCPQTTSVQEVLPDDSEEATTSEAACCGADQATDGAKGFEEGDLYNAEALRLWLLRCCQVGKGGLRDKPGKPPDYYHTCYCLSGLSSAQHYGGLLQPGLQLEGLARADCLCNVVDGRLAEARLFFATHEAI